MTPRRVIAIDGPAASGKSTVARRLAATLGFAWVNSGEFYRALTWWLLPGDTPPAESAAARLAGADIIAEFRGEGAVLLLNGADASAHLRDPAVNARVSPVSQIPEVRAVVGRELRRLADVRDCVVEGRDIGTCVFPATPYKFFIDACPQERARRRSAQGEADPIAERDRLDAGRAVAPLAAAPDAVIIDSTNLGADAVVARILEILRPAGIGT